MMTPSWSAHTFHIPVMGTGFSIDTPLHVARYGISSVISLVDDVLIDQMRRYHCERFERPFESIDPHDEDVRAKRITAYLNLVHDVVSEQVAALKASPFEPGSEITRYFELLPDGPLKQQYDDMLAARDDRRKTELQARLRDALEPGGIDVNVMTKLDRIPYRHGRKVEQHFSDAMAALRGFANSKLASSVIFSAGLNPHLYGYLAAFPDFLPDADGRSRKTVTLKVSDYRSALVQGRYLAKRGIWVSEFRIESGLNCGGHAFASKGNLMGPILEEFKARYDDLMARLHREYNKGLISRSLPSLEQPRQTRITVQGGINTALEHDALMQYYGVDRTGWATPFLLVPEVTSVDDAHLKRLCEATAADVYLGDGSPMGVPFWTLATSDSELARKERIANGKPGSSCPKGYLELSDEFSEVPLCYASRGYQALKLDALEKADLPAETKARLREDVLAKACICNDLAGGATRKYGIDSGAQTAICPSPNIAHFSSLASLEEMVGHIYGRLSLLADTQRPHMFICELGLYVDYLRKELDRVSVGLRTRKLTYYVECKENLLHGIQYYQERFRSFVSEHQDLFMRDLLALKKQLEGLHIEVAG